jgi:hypothetical protein
MLVFLSVLISYDTGNSSNMEERCIIIPGGTPFRRPVQTYSKFGPNTLAGTNNKMIIVFDSAAAPEKALPLLNTTRLNNG